MEPSLQCAGLTWGGCTGTPGSEYRVHPVKRGLKSWIGSIVGEERHAKTICSLARITCKLTMIANEGFSVWCPTPLMNQPKTRRTKQQLC